MKLKEGTYIVKKEDWEEFYERANKKCESNTLFLLPESTKEDLIAYIGTSRFDWYGYDLDTEKIRERCKNRGLTLIEYIPKPKKPKALKLTLEEVMQDATWDWNSDLDKTKHHVSRGIFEELVEDIKTHPLSDAQCLFRKVVIRYLEEVYKEKESTSIISL